jgi:hypothetical protein
MSNNIIPSPEKEKKLELTIENKAIQLLKDIESIRDSSYVSASNYLFMEEALRNLVHAEYYIVGALAYCKGIKTESILNQSGFMNSIMDHIKKSK